MPLPHTVNRQLERQGLGLASLLGPPQPAGRGMVPSPQSQSSTPARTTPSPHTALVQLLRQASVSTWLPSSHSSPGSRMPSPQAVMVQSARHGPGLVLLLGWLQPTGRPVASKPQSQSSPVSSTPSPHQGFRQFSRHALGIWSLFCSPSSHSSPAPPSTTPSPQAGREQFSRHSALAVLPLGSVQLGFSDERSAPQSQASMPICWMPSPQVAGWQFPRAPLGQVSPSAWFPSSQPSSGGVPVSLRNPSPHSAGWQPPWLTGCPEGQSSSLALLPSSHTSGGHTKPSPQPVSTAEQSPRQPSQSSLLPSSHTSSSHTKPSPQPVSTAEQSPRQPSQSSLLPSSQASVESTTPSLHRAGWQFSRHASGAVSELAAPSSHCSPGSSTPSPQDPSTHSYSPLPSRSTHRYPGEHQRPSSHWVTSTSWMQPWLPSVTPSNSTREALQRTGESFG